MTPASLQKLSIRNLRNLQQVDVALNPGVSVFYGGNGQGKTSVLEAVYLLATTKSFRTSRVREMILRGQGAGSVRGVIEGAAGHSEQLVGLSRTERVLKVDGERPTSLAEFVTRLPVVVFHPGDLMLTMGPASGRRTLLDRIALYMNQASLQTQREYVRAMRSRWRLLQQGVGGAAIDVYERVMAERGVQVTRARARAADLLLDYAERVFEQLAPEGLQMQGRYRPGGSNELNVAIEKLAAQREQDARRSGAGFGPHRDDLMLTLNGSPARTDASQGQHRLLTLSLKLAEMECIAESLGIRPLLLLDDVSSELDAGRTEQLFRFVGQQRDQMLVTTTRLELLEPLDELTGGMSVFDVREGVVVQR